MSNIIQVLEKMASDAELQQQDKAAQLIEQSELSDELKQALFDRDASALESQLEDCPEIICSSVVTPEEEPSDIPVPAEDEPTSRLVANG